MKKFARVFLKDSGAYCDFRMPGERAELSTGRARTLFAVLVCSGSFNAAMCAASNKNIRVRFQTTSTPGLNYYDRCKLAEMNDAGLPFKKIADFIERHY
jgi:hypothetical protein